MASKKKANNEAAEQVVAGGQMITVDAKKLSLGLKKTFEGVAMVFDSIGCSEAFGITSAAKEASDNEVEATEPTEEVKAAEPAEPIEAVDEADEPKAEKPKAEPVKPEESEEEPKEEPKVEPAPASTVSIDDITKIIVQKIKQNRSNNEKIGAILKAYGVAKVGELPVTKYEAFLTDLAAV